MSTVSQSLLLFLLNWLDAQLTVLWVRYSIATEANPLMERLLHEGDFSFIGVKFFLGALVALMLYRWEHLPLAQFGLRLSLGVYVTVMLTHAATSVYAF